ncbi:TPA: porin [Neisseria meningitidis]|uniref:porin n=1 Tax=Neisseria meningitidis TaxID=487 RepID=UPI000E572FF6|nr:porin [Neisseria meningitidis]
MRKKLTALVLSALPLAAVADVSLYGEIKAGVEGRNYQLQLTEKPSSTNAKTGNKVEVTKAKSRIRTRISDFGSFIGFKGSEDLGDGLKAVWQLEQDVSVAGGGASQWGNRESFIGLAGEFGTLRAGRVANQFDDASQAINPWDSNNDVASQLGIFKRHDDMPVSVRYDSPEFSGFSGSVQFVPAQNSKSAYKPAYYTKDTNNNLTLVPAVVGKPGSDVYYAGLNYKNGGFAGNYAFKYARHANVGRNAFELFLIGSATSDEAKGTDPLKNHQVHRLTGGYEEGGLNLALAAQLDLSENGDKAKTKNSTTEIAATASYRFGNAVPRISYAHGFDLIERGKKGENTSYDQIIAGVDYDFSKRTSAIVSGAWLKRNTGIGNYTQINAASVGLRHKF